MTRRILISIAVVVCALAIGPAAARAQGGPPLMTDDPGTPEPGTWEVNVAVTGDFTPGTGAYELPVLDVNYGAGSRVQLTAAVPVAFQHSSGEGTHGRLGEIETGAKWRFVDAGAALPVDVSTFPKLVFHPGVGGPAEDTELLLPLEAAREMGPFAVNVDAGRVFQRHAGQRWFYGAAFQYAPAERMQWLAEVHVETGTEDGTVRFLNAGFRRDLDAHRILMFSIGRSVFRGGAAGETVAYLGVQFHG
ncbi:hypothetical protein [Longimicrobium sp.]|uniref:hypothetical protein n=1 Tax=Longimicrobium sp. TaxID=2029185 RepID=UPI002BF717B0|nr:hypothetical protein [Longimicrobium sp.]HSU14747.1 hypothetical protein [Longimicrobium sp.]